MTKAGRQETDAKILWPLLPREHGAWGLLLQPFAAAAVLGREWNVDLAVSLIAILTVFVVREPILVLARQAWVWRDARPETKAARHSLAIEVPVLTFCSIWLWMRLPRVPLAVLGAIAAGITALAVWMALRNRQRSVGLQILSSAALSSTAILAALAATGEIPVWAWLIWGLILLHGCATIFVIRARLHARSKPVEGRQNPHILPAVLAQSVQVLLAIAVVGGGQPWLSGPLLFSAGTNLAELVLQRQQGGLAESVHRVGWRTLATAVLHAAISVLVLW